MASLNTNEKLVSTANQSALYIFRLSISSSKSSNVLAREPEVFGPSYHEHSTSVRVIFNSTMTTASISHASIVASLNSVILTSSIAEGSYIESTIGAQSSSSGMMVNR